ncbi:hypothetical protein TSOC_014052, partial [Tetrabaena socialis]
MLFDPSAAQGTAARVGRVSELSAMEDFRSMVAQGGESASDAVQQLQELVAAVVERSVMGQLYDKAAQWVEVLRAHAASSGRAGAFNSFLRELADWCASKGRGDFVALLAQRLASQSQAQAQAQAGSAAAAVEGEDDGGAVAPAEAAAFAERHSAVAAAEEEDTLMAVVQDEEFDEMD